ncbi:MAG TPA: circadian clock KaiB family protein [Wenzhouxiangellaceae bacterium]|nr:circadian clock KaiB family protein [Wenzhouxiangellaceae bacterium]
MNASSDVSESPVPELILFITGNAPRSHRARKNLAEALESLDLESVEPLEIDLMKHPEHTVNYSVFATPALLRTDDSGDVRVLYGDLSDERKLSNFLGEIRSS